MTVPKWLAGHPANAFAAACLKELKVPGDPRTLPLLALATEYLRRAKPKTFPWPEYQAELLERAEGLAGDSPTLAASLLVPEFERLASADERLPPAMRRRQLAEQLSDLLAALKRRPTVLQAGKLLAENLYLNLRQAYPAFGHLSD